MFSHVIYPYDRELRWTSRRFQWHGRVREGHESGGWNCLGAQRVDNPTRLISSDEAFSEASKSHGQWWYCCSGTVPLGGNIVTFARYGQYILCCRMLKSLYLLPSWSFVSITGSVPWKSLQNIRTLLRYVGLPVNPCLVSDSPQICMGDWYCLYALYFSIRRRLLLRRLLLDLQFLQPCKKGHDNSSIVKLLPF